MVEDLRAIAEYLNDIADEIEEGNFTEDDWCSSKMSIDIEISRLREIQSEMGKHYD